MMNRPYLGRYCLAVAFGTVGPFGTLVLTQAVPPPFGLAVLLLGGFLSVMAWAAWVGIGAEYRRYDAETRIRLLKERVTLVPTQVAPAVPQADPDPSPEGRYQSDWEAAARRFVAAGNRRGFNIRRLADPDDLDRVIAWHDWARMVNPLIEGGWLIGGWGRHTRWAADKNFDRWEAERGWEGPPYPAEERPPEVRLTVNGRRASTVIEARVGGSEEEPAYGG